MYVEERDNIPLGVDDGYVTVVVQTQIPQRINFGLVLEEQNGTLGPRITTNGTLGHSYLLGDARVIQGKALVCWGRVLDPNHGRFEVHCEFFQRGQLIKQSKSAAGQLTGNFADFGVICSLQ